MAGTRTSDRGIISGINVTPLVDITLVLLIIFIVTAKIVVTPAVPLDLPSASSASSVQVIFSVMLPMGGTTLVDGAVVANDRELTNRAREAAKAHPELRAVIHADGSTEHRRLMQVMDALKEAGVSRIAFAAAPAESPTSFAAFLRNEASVSP